MGFAGGDALSRFTRDLTREAAQGRLEPVCCRDAEISRVVDILLRQGKNNPALVGPAGVGKTAVVEGLAQRVDANEVPLALRGSRILSLDHVGLLAGTSYRGEYEERLRAIVDETSNAPDAILFIDELHNLIGQGSAMGVAMDAANMLKPALVRGAFRVIGATTETEYAQWIRGDPALERRFQRVSVNELSAEATLAVLRARAQRLARHHAVLITDDALVAAVELTDAHPADRHRPDRAIDALDEACAHVHGATTYSPEAERLILERRAAVRREAAQSARRTSAFDSRSGENDTDDTLDLFARESVAALERIGAHLEALLGDDGTGHASAPPRANPARGDRAEARGDPVPSPRRPAELDEELERRLERDGVVVRGTDVARVVGLGVGRAVTWGGDT